MKTSPIRRLLLTLCTLLVGGIAQANDFPTIDRVLYVQECMLTHPGPQFEMSNKCSCALDTLANEVGFEDYVTMSTISKATSMAGERGGVIRDAPSLAPQVKRYRELQAKARKACFINSSTK